MMFTYLTPAFSTCYNLEMHLVTFLMHLVTKMKYYQQPLSYLKHKPI